MKQGIEIRDINDLNNDGLVKKLAEAVIEYKVRDGESNYEFIFPKNLSKSLLTLAMFNGLYDVSQEYSRLLASEQYDPDSIKFLGEGRLSELVAKSQKAHMLLDMLRETKVIKQLRGLFPLKYR
jgi:hypothetical protein